jgi:UDP-glucose 4-epimerase
MTDGRVLVTGAGGFCGRAITAALVAGGHDVVATVRPGSVARTLPDANVELVECDMTDGQAIARLVARVRPERCVHAAAAGARARCDDLDLLLRTNVGSTVALAESLAGCDATRLVTLGSSSEYGTPLGAMSESAVAAPDDLYGVSKLAAGLAAHAVGRIHDLETMHLRLFSVYGPGEAPGRLVASVVRAIAERRPIELTGGRQVRDFVFIDDVVDATLHALFSDTPDAGTFNIGTGIETSIRELALTACGLAGADSAILRFGALPYRSDERFTWRADTTRTAALLGWRATTTLRTGLSSTLAAVRDELRIPA